MIEDKKELASQLMKEAMLGTSLCHSINYFYPKLSIEFGLDFAFMLACMSSHYEGTRQVHSLIKIGQHEFCHFNKDGFFPMYPLWERPKGMSLIIDLEKAELISTTAHDKKGNFLYLIGSGN
tara:strand:+ start:134 stop:499 length:366 start_codon:yes stop_codon:yes gene_type:complete